MTAKTFISAICVALLVASSAVAEAVVIVNKANPVKGVSLKDLGKLYKGKRRRWIDGTPVKLVLPQSGSSEMAKLLSAIGIKSEEALSRLYLKLIYQQKIQSEPSKLDASSAVKAVMADKGAIAVVDDSAASGGDVRVIKVDGL
ncbi:MAG: hypothetical protein D6808_03665 [Candidatus Dadabacteria bacterium]|nr:MAG: hypothetical protein D6808_03665 [Candidatus Dadabacteria bacterium]